MVQKNLHGSVDPSKRTPADAAQIANAFETSGTLCQLAANLLSCNRESYSLISMITGSRSLIRRIGQHLSRPTELTCVKPVNSKLGLWSWQYAVIVV